MAKIRCKLPLLFVLLMTPVFMALFLGLQLFSKNNHQFQVQKLQNVSTQYDHSPISLTHEVENVEYLKYSNITLQFLVNKKGFRNIPVKNISLNLRTKSPITKRSGSDAISSMNWHNFLLLFEAKKGINMYKWMSNNKIPFYKLSKGFDFNSLSIKLGHKSQYVLNLGEKINPNLSTPSFDCYNLEIWIYISNWVVEYRSFQRNR